MGLALTALLLESVLRLGFGLGHPLLYAVDQHVGYITAPRQEIRPFGVTTRINAFGMRSDDVSAAKPAGVTRLLFIGDSVTLGTTHVDQSDLFTERIKVALVGSGVPWQVMNASAGGWGADNEYEYLITRGTFGAAKVIFVINSGDLDQPFTRLEVSPQFPTREPYTALGEVWDRFLMPRLDQRIHVADPGSILAKMPNLGNAAHMLETLSRAKSYTESNGAQFALIFSPGMDFAKMDPAWNVVFKRFKDWAAANSTELIDMSPIYARYANADIYRDAIHLKPFAHELIASAFLTWLDESPSAALSAAEAIPDRTQP